jgi:HlyD family secretion protein
VSADIEIARHDHALALQPEAVHDLGGGAPWVLLVRNGRTERQPVRVGLRGEAWVEIVDGLAGGDLVVPAANGKIHPGERVRPRPLPAPGPNA